MRELTLAESVWPAIAPKMYFRWPFPLIEEETVAEVRPRANRMRVWAEAVPTYNAKNVSDKSDKVSSLFIMISFYLFSSMLKRIRPLFNE